MTESANLVNDPTQIVFRNVRRMRRARKWSCRELADRLTAVGCPVKGHVLRNREFPDRVAGIPLFHTVALAHVFGVKLEDLMAIECLACGDAPPVGFACLTCGHRGPGS